MKSEFTITSSKDGLTLSAVEVRPEEEIRGVVVLVHGMAEYKERYLPFMEYLASLGYACVMHDHRGHGKSVRSQEDLGYMYENGAESIVSDVHDMVLEAKKRFPSKPIHLFGHSMGSLIVRCYLQDHDEELTSLTVSGLVAKNPAAGVGKGMAKLLKLFKGERHRSKLMTNIAFGSYNKGFENPKSPNAWLNTDEAAVAAYDADPLCGFMFTLNGYENLMELVLRCYKRERYQKKNLKLPVLFLSGNCDPCCAGEKGFYDAVDFLKGMGYGNVSGVMMQGMRHEILNEPEHEKVYKLIAVHLGAAGLKEE